MWNCHKKKYIKLIEAVVVATLAKKNKKKNASIN